MKKKIIGIVVVMTFFVGCGCQQDKESVVDDNKDANGNIIDDGCQTWFDGCNTCQIGEPGMPMGCTKKFCDPMTLQPARCMDQSSIEADQKKCSEAGGVWSDEQNSCFENPATMVGSDEDTKKCNIDSDCVAAQCCHATSTINKNYAPNCDGVMCTMSCETVLDCGAGKPVCNENRCDVKVL